MNINGIMEWQHIDKNKPIVNRILVISKDTGHIHLVHWDDYNEWCLTEMDTKYESAGLSIDFDLWMPVPPLPDEVKAQPPSSSRK